MCMKHNSMNPVIISTGCFMWAWDGWSTGKFTTAIMNIHLSDTELHHGLLHMRGRCCHNRKGTLSPRFILHAVNIRMQNILWFPSCNKCIIILMYRKYQLHRNYNLIVTGKTYIFSINFDPEHFITTTAVVHENRLYAGCEVHANVHRICRFVTCGKWES